MSIDFANAARAAGADIVTISDPVASGDLLSAEQYAEFAAPYERQVFAAVAGPTVLHICGFTRDEMPHVREVGTWGFSFEEKVAVKDAVGILGDKVSAIGNVAPVKALLNGTPDDVRRHAEQCFEDGIDLLSSGCAVPPLTRLDNLRALAASGGLVWSAIRRSPLVCLQLFVAPPTRVGGKNDRRPGSQPGRR